MEASRDPELLSIGEVARSTGLSTVNLRAWERRYGFPRPARAAAGHRRYPPAEVERILRVIDQRGRGVGLRVAIERVQTESFGVPSLYASLRSRRPELQTMRMQKRHLLGLCRAIEDESLARAEEGILVGAFQQEHFYRQSEERWRRLAAPASAAIVFADFGSRRPSAGTPVEISLGGGHPMVREWACVCVAPEHVACLVGWETPAREGLSDGSREFEVLFTLEPAVVREAAGIALTVAAGVAPETAGVAREQLAGLVSPTAEAQLRLAADITSRTLARLE